MENDPSNPEFRMFRACVFDLDGTLVDSLADLAASCNHALAQEGLPTHPTEAYRLLLGYGIAKLIEGALPEQCRIPETITRTRTLMEQHYDVHCLDRTRPYDGIDELLTELGDLKRAVVSNKPDRFAKRIVYALFGDGFDVVMGQREGVPRKPDPAGLLEACSIMGVEPAECLYLGDSGVDMLTAHAAGMFAAGALWGFRGSRELAENGAQALVAAPHDLLDVLRAHRPR